MPDMAYVIYGNATYIKPDRPSRIGVKTSFLLFRVLYNFKDIGSLLEKKRDRRSFRMQLPTDSGLAVGTFNLMTRKSFPPSFKKDMPDAEKFQGNRAIISSPSCSGNPQRDVHILDRLTGCALNQIINGRDKQSTGECAHPPLRRYRSNWTSNKGHIRETSGWQIRTNLSPS